MLVACFGYQGFRNAKFGRIELHEVINVVARETLLTVKQQLEAGGWRVEYTDSPEEALENANACVVCSEWDEIGVLGAESDEMATPIAYMADV